MLALFAGGAAVGGAAAGAELAGGVAAGSGGCCAGGWSSYPGFGEASSCFFSSLGLIGKVTVLFRKGS